MTLSTAPRTTAHSITRPIVTARYTETTRPAERIAAHPSPAVYRRRRAVAALIAVGLGLVVSSTADGLVGRGDGPTATVEQARRYIVQPGDTLWSIGEQFHGAAPLGDYVDVLVQVNGGAGLTVGQVITLP